MSHTEEKFYEFYIYNFIVDITYTPNSCLYGIILHTL